MMGALYQLDQKTVWWSVFGLSIGGCLVFLAGMVVGISLGGASLLAEGGASPPPVAPAGETVAVEAAALPSTVPAPSLPMAPAVKAPVKVPVKAPVKAPVVKVPAVDPASMDAADPLGPQGSAEPEALLAEQPQAGEDENDPVASPFSLQVGAYLMQENLNQALEELQKKGLEARVVEITDSRGTVLSSVRVGEYGDRASAETAASQLRQKKGLEVLVKRDVQQG